MKKRRTVSVRAHARVGQKLSITALASYLSGLADVNDLPGAGNPMLADALRGLAKAVLNKSIKISDSDAPKEIERNRESARPLKHVKKKPNSQLGSALSKQLSELTEKEIQKFVEDESKTKDELLQLASFRFSMPLSQLRRSKTEDVRQAIRTALLHESSMQILSQEAEREGKARSS